MGSFIISRKADGGIISIGIFIAVIIFLVWGINFSTRECSRDSDCKKTQYCGSDFSCHMFPASQNAVIEGGSGTVIAAGLIALGLVIAAIILRKNGSFSFPWVQKKNGQHHRHPEHAEEKEEGKNWEEGEKEEHYAITPYYESVSESYIISPDKDPEADEEHEFRHGKHGHGAAGH